MTVKYIYPDIPNVKLVYMDRSDFANGFSIKNDVQMADNSFMNYATADKLLIAYNRKIPYAAFAITSFLSEPLWISP